MGGGAGGAGSANAFAPREEDSAEYTRQMAEQGVMGEVESEAEGGGEIEKAGTRINSHPRARRVCAKERLAAY